MRKFLIVYSETQIISISDILEGTAVVTPYKYMVETLQNAKVMLNALGVDTSKIDKYKSTEDSYE